MRPGALPPSRSRSRRLSCAAALRGQVPELADVGPLGRSVTSARWLGGVRAREAHAQLGGEVGDSGHEVVEVVAPAAAQPVQVLEARTIRAVRRLRCGLQHARGLVAMRVHVVTKQHQLLHALAGEAAALLQDCVDVPRSLPPTSEGPDAAARCYSRARLKQRRCGRRASRGRGQCLRTSPRRRAARWTSGPSRRRPR